MDSKQIAQTIIQQLGGNRFLAMTGAKNLTYGPASLQMALPTGLSPVGVNRVKITLDDSDTYTVTFGKLQGVKYRLMGEVSGVYCDMLEDVFTENTGLFTRFGRKVA
jgi:hypothetical protein